MSVTNLKPYPVKPYPLLCEVLMERAPLAVKNPDVARVLNRVLLVAFGVILLTLCAKIKFPIPGSPVPVSMGTFGVLMIGAGYGMRLGLMTICAYLLVGLLGFDVFSNSSADSYGWAYMSGGTGGYLFGFLIAAAFQGWVARLGWDRSIGFAMLAMVLGNAIIYVFGLAWLGVVVGWDKPLLQWGLHPFIFGDILKIALAGCLLPALWAMINRTKS